MDIAQLSLLTSSAVEDDFSNRQRRRMPGMEPIVDRGHCWWLDSHGTIINVLSFHFGKLTGVENLIGERFWELGVQSADQVKLKAFIGEAILAKKDNTFLCSMNELPHGKQVRVSIRVNESSCTRVAASAFTQPILAGHELLSERESRTLEILSNGYLPQEIANQMACSRSTVQTYLARARKKLNINTFVGLIAYAARIY